jgi:prepilin-type N-terminal cleavage/methylation domain-containing protein
MRTRLAMQKTRQRGFTLMEVLVATIVLFSGIVAVAQIVPVALTVNTGNRRDSGATVIAQRVLAQFVQLPVTSPNPFIDPVPNSPCSLGCNLGDPTQPGVTVGNPVVIIGNRPAINFGAAAVAGYSFTTVADPEDPSGAIYDIRWAVITSGNGATASSRRFIIGARQINPTTSILPLTLDAMVQR